jgi:hypothetical protein
MVFEAMAQPRSAVARRWRRTTVPAGSGNGAGGTADGCRSLLAIMRETSSSGARSIDVQSSQDPMQAFHKASATVSLSPPCGRMRGAPDSCGTSRFSPRARPPFTSGDGRWGRHPAALTQYFGGPHGILPTDRRIPSTPELRPCFFEESAMTISHRRLLSSASPCARAAAPAARSVHRHHAPERAARDHRRSARPSYHRPVTSARATSARDAPASPLRPWC